MDLRNRREFLKLCAASAPTLVFANSIDADEIKKAAVAQPAYRTPGTLERFIDPLPIPKRLKPYGTRKDRVQYRMRMLEFSQQLHSQLPPTKLWGYEGQYPGPTIEAVRDRPIEVRWENRLAAAAYLHGGSAHTRRNASRAPEVRTVPHLHGSRTRSESDGLPEKWFTPGLFGALFLS